MIIFMRAYNARRGWAHRQRVSTTFLTLKISHNFFLCSGRRSNLGSLNSESEALPTDPPRHFEFINPVREIRAALHI